jgi:hypothetical protein
MLICKKNQARQGSLGPTGQAETDLPLLAGVTHSNHFHSARPALAGQRVIDRGFECFERLHRLLIEERQQLGCIDARDPAFRVDP